MTNSKDDGDKMKIRLLRQQIKSREYRHQDFYQRISKKYLLHDSYKFAGVSLIFLLGSQDSNQEQGEDKHHLLLFLRQLFYCWQNAREGTRAIANSYTLSMNLRLSLGFLYHQLSSAEQRLIAVEAALCKRLLNRETISEQQMSESQIFREWQINGSSEQAEAALMQKLNTERSVITKRNRNKISVQQPVAGQRINPGISYAIRTQGRTLLAFKQTLEYKKETSADRIRRVESGSELSKIIGQWLDADRRIKSRYESYQLKSPLAEAVELKQHRTQVKQVLGLIQRSEKRTIYPEVQRRLMPFLMRNQMFPKLSEANRFYHEIRLQRETMDAVSARGNVKQRESRTNIPRAEHGTIIRESLNPSDVSVDLVLSQKSEQRTIYPEILRKLMPFSVQAQKFPTLPEVDRFYHEIWLHRKAVSSANARENVKQRVSSADVILQADRGTTINEWLIPSETSADLLLLQKSEQRVMYPEILRRLMPFSVQNQKFPTLPEVARFHHEIWSHRKAVSSASVRKNVKQRESSADILRAEREAIIREGLMPSDISVDLVLSQKSEQRMMYPEILRRLLLSSGQAKRLSTLPSTDRGTTINEWLIPSDISADLALLKKSEQKMVHPEILRKLMPFSVQAQKFPTLPEVDRFYHEIWLHRKAVSSANARENVKQRVSSADVILQADRGTTINEWLIPSETSADLLLLQKSEQRVMYPEILRRLMPFSVQNQKFPTLPEVARFHHEIWSHRKAVSSASVRKNVKQRESSADILRAEREAIIREGLMPSDISVDLVLSQKSEQRMMYPEILRRLLLSSGQAKRLSTLPSTDRGTTINEWLIPSDISAGLALSKKSEQKMIHPGLLRKLMPFSVQTQKHPTLPEVDRFYHEIWLHRKAMRSASARGNIKQGSSADILQADRGSSINEWLIPSDTSAELVLLQKSEQRTIHPEILRKLMPFTMQAQRFPTLPSVNRFYNQIWLQREMIGGVSARENVKQKESGAALLRAERGTTISESLIPSDISAGLVLLQKLEQRTIYPEILSKLMPFFGQVKKFPTLPEVDRFYQELWSYRKKENSKKEQDIAGEWSVHIDIHRAERNTDTNKQHVHSDTLVDLVVPRKSQKRMMYPKVLHKLMPFSVPVQKFPASPAAGRFYHKIWLHRKPVNGKNIREFNRDRKTYIDLHRAERNITINKWLNPSDTSGNLVLSQKLEKQTIYPEILSKLRPLSRFAQKSSALPAVETRQYGTARQEHRKKPAAAAGYYTESEGGREIQTIRAKVDSSGPVFERQEVKIQRMEKELTQQKKALDEMVQQFNTTVKKENVSVGQMTERVLKEMQKQFRLEKVRRGFS